MSRFTTSQFPEIDLHEAARWNFRLFSVVGIDAFTRRDAAAFLGFGYTDARFSRIFSSLRMYGLTDREARGRQNYYRVSERGRLLALHTIQVEPQLGEESMTPAGAEYLERRLAEIASEFLDLPYERVFPQ